MQEYLGPTEFWDGAMADPVVRKTKVIKIVESSTFTVLEMQFPNTPATTGAADAVALSSVTFPATFEIRDVASFQLATGSIQAIYSQGQPSL